MADTATLEREIADLRTAITAAETAAQAKKAQVDAAAAEARSKGQNPYTSDELFTQLDTGWKEADSERQRASNLNGRLQTALQHLAQERGWTGADPELLQHRGERDAIRAYESIGAGFRESDEYKSFRSRMVQGEEIISGVPIGTINGGELVNRNAARDVLKRGLEEIRFRTTMTQTEVPIGSLIMEDQQPGIYEQRLRPIRVTQLVTVGTTDSHTVRWVLENTRTDAAAETPFGTALPESAYSFTSATSTVKRIGHWIPAHKDVLADAGQLETMINQRLVSGLQLRVESQMVNGTGAGENLRGILNTSGILTQALGGDTRFDAFHKAMTQMRLQFFEPSVVLIHPSDYEELVLSKDTAGAYIFGTPDRDFNPSIWGLLPVVTPVIPVGTAVVGNFREGATLWVRTGIAVNAADTHADFFIRGMVAIACEMRAGFAATQPKAFCTVTGV